MAIPVSLLPHHHLNEKRQYKPRLLFFFASLSLARTARVGFDGIDGALNESNRNEYRKKIKTLIYYDDVAVVAEDDDELRDFGVVDAGVLI